MGRPCVERLGKNLHLNTQIGTHASVDRFLIWSEQWRGGWMQRLQCSLKLALGREEHSSWRRPAYWV